MCVGDFDQQNIELGLNIISSDFQPEVSFLTNTS